MKIRQGFVSNSSSSSFICSITGAVEGGYDCSLSDVGMVECVKGHVMYESYNQEVSDWVRSDSNDDYNNSMPANICPVCNGAAKNDIMLRSISNLEHLGITIDELREFAIESKLKGTIS